MKKYIDFYNKFLLCFFFGNIASFFMLFPIGLRFIYGKVFLKYLSVVLFDEAYISNGLNVFDVLLFLLPICFVVLLCSKKTASNIYINVIAFIYMLLDISMCIYSMITQFLVGLDSVNIAGSLNMVLFIVIFWCILAILVITIILIRNEKVRAILLICIYMFYLVVLFAVMLSCRNIFLRIDILMIFCLIEDIILSLIIFMRIKQLKIQSENG